MVNAFLSRTLSTAKAVESTLVDDDGEATVVDDAGAGAGAAEAMAETSAV